MFSRGQLIFALFFVIAFTIAMIIAYKNDTKLHHKFYKGSYRILIGFILFIIILFLIKIFFKKYN